MKLSFALYRQQKTQRSTKQTLCSGITKEPLLQDQLVELEKLVKLLNMQEGLYFFLSDAN